MKNPNGYGAICRLSGKRRKKYAVRISCGYRERICLPNKAECYKYVDRYGMKFRKNKNDYVVDGTDAIKETLDKYNILYKIEYVRKFRYLQYFERSSDAHKFLAEYNREDPIREHVSRTQEPTFEQVYHKYIQFAKSLNKPPSKASLQAYKTGFNNWSDIHDVKFRGVTTLMLQDVLTAHGTMSRSSVGKMITILRKMYKYGMAHRLCDEDITKWLFQEHSDEPVIVHKPFTDEEIERLWNTDSKAAKITLVLIYCGFRCSEFLKLENANIHLDERYLVGGIKTEAGRDRIIPIHKRVDPILREYYNPDSKYFFPNGIGGEMRYSQFISDYWNPYQEELGMEHYTHDCRHTFSTKLEQIGVSELHRKLIIGHSLQDDVTALYTHVSTEQLIADIDLWK